MFFDAEIFAHEAVSRVRFLVDQLNGGTDARIEVVELEKDIEATLAAIEVERNGVRARALRDDLEKFLPSRKSAILSAVHKSGVGTIAMEQVSQALDETLAASRVAARAFTAKLI